MAPQDKKEKRVMKPTTRVVTFNLHRALKGYQGKEKAPRAIRELKKLAFREMGTTKVLVKPSLNIKLWGNGIRHVPHKLRVKIVRKYDDSEGASENDFVSELDFVNVENFDGLTTQVE